MQSFSAHWSIRDKINVAIEFPLSSTRTGAVLLMWRRDLFTLPFIKLRFYPDVAQRDVRLDSFRWRKVSR